MSGIQKISAFCGAMLLGFAYLIVKADRQRIQGRRQAVAVEELGDQLKQAWAEHHIA